MAPGSASGCKFAQNVFVPSFGDLFLMHWIQKAMKCWKRRVFVPSSGDLFLIGPRHRGIARPAHRVFVPSSGDLFLIRAINIGTKLSRHSFRPLFWGFVFNDEMSRRIAERAVAFSSPLLGICF